MKLLIAIPALNEEESIGDIIERCLSARQYIIAHSPVTEVEVTVVSDGSTDRTAELARRYIPHIRLIEFERNRGYGAAIKEAWRHSNAALLGFLDADGTCDPRFFAELCSTLAAENADVVLGSRMNAQSRMPLLRRAGNTFFAALCSVFSRRRVRDTASGMRVVRASALARLLPLPDGLHFTPAMSARALLNRQTSIVEIDMPYHERRGESKLRIGKDGLRFLRVILSAALLYRPSRPLAITASVFLAVAAGLLAAPVAHYLQAGTVDEWMINRILVANLAWTNAWLLFAASYLSAKVVRIALNGELTAFTQMLDRFFSSRWFTYVPAAFMAAGAVLVMPGVAEHLGAGSYSHWSRFVAASMLFTPAFVMICTRAVDFVLHLIREELSYSRPGTTAREAPAGELSAVHR